MCTGWNRLCGNFAEKQNYIKEPFCRLHQKSVNVNKERITMSSVLSVIGKAYNSTHNLPLSPAISALTPNKQQSEQCHVGEAGPTRAVKPIYFVNILMAQCISEPKERETVEKRKK